MCDLLPASPRLNPLNPSIAAHKMSRSSPAAPPNAPSSSGIVNFRRTSPSFRHSLSKIRHSGGRRAMDRTRSAQFASPDAQIAQQTVAPPAQPHPDGTAPRQHPSATAPPAPLHSDATAQHQSSAPGIVHNKESRTRHAHFVMPLRRVILKRLPERTDRTVSAWRIRLVVYGARLESVLV